MPGPLPDGDRHVVLVGHAGPGRIDIGRRLARLLQRPFADADEQLELRAGRSLSRLAREHGREVLRRREAAVLAGLLTQDVALVILAPGAFEIDPRNRALLARSALVVWPRGPMDAAARSSPLSDHYEDVADHIVDVEPFHTSDDRAPSAIARHIVQLVRPGALGGLERVPDRAAVSTDDRRCEADRHAASLSEDGLSALLEDIADHIVDVESFRTGGDDPDGAIARHIARRVADDEPRPGRDG